MSWALRERIPKLQVNKTVADSSNLFLLAKSQGMNRSSLIPIESHDGKTPLHLAAEHGLQSSVRILLDRMLDIDVQDSSGRTALHLAVKNKHECVVKALLARQRSGSNDAVGVNIQDHEGNTALHVAVSTAQEAMVDLLLRTRQAELELKDSQGRTALHLAVLMGCDKVIQLLLNNSADINARVG